MLNNKVVLIFFALSFTLIFGSGCDLTTDAATELVEAGENVEEELDHEQDFGLRGNTVGNIVNAGIAAQQSDWIYYKNFEDGGKIYKFNTESKEDVQVNNVDSWHINVVGDWIYYTEVQLSGSGFSSRVERHLLSKVRTDGSGQQQFDNTNANFVNVVGNWIYYANLDDDSKIYKIRSDGTENKKLNDENSGYINVVDDWIYYSNLLGGGKIYKIDINGNNRTRVNDDWSGYINVVGDWIYYSRSFVEYEGELDPHEPQDSGIMWTPITGAMEECGRLFKVRTDGTETTQLNDDYSVSINVFGDWIYYVNYYEINSDRNWNIYKIRKDGTERTEVTDDNSIFVNIVDDWIFYSDVGGMEKTYRLQN